MSEARKVYTKGEYEVIVSLRDDATGGWADVRDLGGQLPVGAGYEERGARWYFGTPKRWWHRHSMEEATFKAITWLQHRLEQEMTAAQKLEVLQDTLDGLQEALT